MKVLSPQLPATLDTTEANQFVSEASLEAIRFEKADWTGLVANSVGLDEVVVEKSILVAVRLERFAVRDALFSNCDFSAAQCSEISLQRVCFKGGRMTGWDCNKGHFKDVIFENCKLDMINFRFTKLTRIRFISCMMADADFLGSELSEVNFENCLLERTDFSNCKLKGVDLRTSQLIGLKGWQYLKGATIDNVQLMSAAPYLANEIGISVFD